MSNTRETLTTVSKEVAFRKTFTADGIQLGNIIDLTAIKKLQIRGSDQNTANTFQEYSTEVIKVDFFIEVSAYTAGNFTPIIEGIGTSAFPPQNPQLGFPEGTQCTLAAATTLFPANPDVNTTYAVGLNKLVAYNYAANFVPQSGSFIKKRGQEVIDLIKNGITNADAVLDPVTTPAKFFRFSVLPGFGDPDQNYAFLRLSMLGAGGASATINVDAVLTYAGVF